MAEVDSFQLLYREISRSCDYYVETLALVGALYTASRAVILLRDCCTLVRVHFLPRMIPSKKLTHRYGDWAVIHGKIEEHHAVSCIFMKLEGCVCIHLLDRKFRCASTCWHDL